MLDNKIKKHLTKLKQKKYRKEFGEFVVEGIKGVEEVLNSNFEIVVVIVEGNRREEEPISELIKLAEKKDIPVEFCGRKDVDNIKTTDTYPGVTAVVEMEDTTLDDLSGNIICLDGIKDPGNLGTIIRTADWFGVESILLSEGSVDPYSDKVVRSTMGSIFHTKIFKTQNISQAIETLKKKGYNVYTLSMEGEDFNKIKADKKSVFIFGSESHGVSEELLDLSDKTYTIPGKGKAESLNVAISSGILMSKI